MKILSEKDLKAGVEDKYDQEALSQGKKFKVIPKGSDSRFWRKNLSEAKQLADEYERGTKVVDMSRNTLVYVK